jgi:hypothetical protein
MEALADEGDGEGDDDEGSAHSDGGGEEEEDDEEEDAKPKGNTSIQKPRPIPVKRARLAYSIFCDEKRPEIQEAVSAPVTRDRPFEVSNPGV